MLKVNAAHSTAFGEKTYFVAAVSSIKDSSKGKVFTAKAYAKLADDSVVDGAAATGTYPAE